MIVGKTRNGHADRATQTAEKYLTRLKYSEIAAEKQPGAICNP
jgi:hypothetical protein